MPRLPIEHLSARRSGDSVLLYLNGAPAFRLGASSEHEAALVAALLNERLPKRRMRARVSWDGAVDRLEAVRRLSRDGKTSAQIGAVLGIHDSTVRYYLSRRCKAAYRSLSFLP